MTLVYYLWNFFARSSSFPFSTYELFHCMKFAIACGETGANSRREFPFFGAFFFFLSFLPLFSFSVFLYAFILPYSFRLFLSSISLYRTRWFASLTVCGCKCFMSVLEYVFLFCIYGGVFLYVYTSVCMCVSLEMDVCLCACSWRLELFLKCSMVEHVKT